MSNCSPTNHLKCVAKTLIKWSTLAHILRKSSLFMTNFTLFHTLPIFRSSGNTSSFSACCRNRRGSERILPWLFQARIDLSRPCHWTYCLFQPPARVWLAADTRSLTSLVRAILNSVYCCINRVGELKGNGCLRKLYLLHRQVLPSSKPATWTRC